MHLNNIECVLKAEDDVYISLGNKIDEIIKYAVIALQDLPMQHIVFI